MTSKTKTLLVHPSGGRGNRLFTIFFAMSVARDLGINWQASPRIPELNWTSASNQGSLTFPRLHRHSTVTHSDLPRGFESALDLIRSSLEGRHVARISGPILGETFFDACRVDPKVFFPRISQVNQSSEPVIAVHLRGTDFAQWNRDAILPLSYYENAIELAREWIGGSPRVILVTDDPKLDTVQSLSRIPAVTLDAGSRDADRDFNILRSADVIVSSPSTFCIWAGILGRGLIVHSHHWVRTRTELGDKFWADLYAGGNIFYKASALV